MFDYQVVKDMVIIEAAVCWCVMCTYCIPLLECHERRYFGWSVGPDISIDGSLKSLDMQMISSNSNVSSTSNWGRADKSRAAETAGTGLIAPGIIDTPKHTHSKVECQCVVWSICLSRLFWACGPFFCVVLYKWTIYAVNTIHFSSICWIHQWDVLVLVTGGYWRGAKMGNGKGRLTTVEAFPESGRWRIPVV